MDKTNKLLLPELFFGLVGPIGVDLDEVQNELEAELIKVGYDVQLLHVTELMRDVHTNVEVKDDSYFNKYNSLISYADAVCEKFESKAALAALCVAAIIQSRQKVTGVADKPALGTAFIIRQFKRPAEIELMRKTYGRKFVQVSVSAAQKDRRSALIERIKDFDESIRENEECEKQAIELIRIDHDESDHDYGQKISKVFHLGDVFVDGASKPKIQKTIFRFIQAFFGHNGKSPTLDEYGMYHAAAASFRSIDLSRQVGASIFSEHGEVLALGCNEVPKPFGGTYWDNGDAKSFRDFDKGRDANHSRKLQILYDLIQRMGKADFLSEKVLEKETVRERLRLIMQDESIQDSQVMDIIEFGRMIHAEMSAITDAARTGVPIRGGTMYTTAFPCHMCAKHIVSSGINRLVYLEPYPKSYASELHSDSITFDQDLSSKMVIFEPFIGISPRRYRDIFEKKNRKDGKGIARDWYFGEPQPMLEDLTPAYMEENEPSAVAILKNLKKTAAN